MCRGTIADGGSGVVFIASLGNEATVVSAKEIKDTQLNPDDTTELELESRNLTMLGNHPNTTRLFGFCKKKLAGTGFEGQLRAKLAHCGIREDSEHQYIVMEYCKNGSLQQIIHDASSEDGLICSSKTRTALLTLLVSDSRFKVKWSLQIASAIKYLHLKQYVHRCCVCVESLV